MSSSGGSLRDQGSKFHTIIAGAISGLTARFLTAPLDVVKIRLQVQPLATSSGILRNRGILQTIKSLYLQGGVTVFWRGNISASWLYIVYNTTQFSAYRSTTSILKDSSLPNTLVLGLSGALAGVIATATAYPFDLVRTRFAAQGSVPVYKNFRSSIKSIYNQEGPVGFYRGLTVAICQGAPYMGLLFGVYESLRPVLSSFDMPVGSGDAFAGAMASGIAKTGTYPLDLIRKRLQMQGPSRLNFADGRIPEYQKGFWSAGKVI